NDDAVVRVVDPQMAVTKTVGAAVANGDGTFTVTYIVTAANTGTIDTVYSLDDQLLLAPDLLINSASASAPDITVSSTWNGRGDTRLVTDQPIAAGVVHVYTVTVVVTTTTSVLDSSSDCVLDAGESGTGTYNRAVLSHEDDVLEATACVPDIDLPHVLPAPTTVPPVPGGLPSTGTDAGGGVLAAVGLLAVGGLLLAIRRRGLRRV
ncbi:MAG TPA: LPXTG cell wall anchor domain-containing protein, partial [Ilumatobacteraceae bacterium]|nr:LPXTG cell wall anchor domain-containing protein [Ilumatobacteraceae bacterium]